MLILEHRSGCFCHRFRQVSFDVLVQRIQSYSAFSTTRAYSQRGPEDIKNTAILPRLLFSFDPVNRILFVAFRTTFRSVYGRTKGSFQCDWRYTAYTMRIDVISVAHVGRVRVATHINEARGNQVPAATAWLCKSRCVVGRSDSAIQSEAELSQVTLHRLLAWANTMG